MAFDCGIILRSAALRFSHRPALLVPGPEGVERVTYDELDRRARIVAVGLQRAGVEPGDRIGLLGANSADLVAAWFAVVYAGATVVPLPVGARARELALRLRHAKVRAVIVDRPQAEVGANVHVLSIDSLTRSENAVGRLSASTTDPPPQAMILYTSGTEARPKGVMISHASLLLHCASLTHHSLRLQEDDRVLGVLPIAHSYGIRMTILAPFFVGASTVLLPRFDRDAAWNALLQHGVTWFPGVPTMFAALTEAPHSPPPALRWCLSAGAPLPRETRRAAEQCLGTEIREGYGLTEATFSTMNAPPAPQVEGSVGMPNWGVELRIDPRAVPEDDGASRRDPHAPTLGEIQIRGANQMLGYLDDSAATRAAMPDGWLRTGDVGYLDNEGHLYLVDRIKDVILRGGHTVYPAEVEEELLTHPGVVQASVFGVPDAHYGEEIAAALVCRAPFDIDAFGRWLEKNIASRKRPRHVRSLPSLPLGASGKVQKRALREGLVSELSAPKSGARNRAPRDPEEANTEREGHAAEAEVQPPPETDRSHRRGETEDGPER